MHFECISKKVDTNYNLLIFYLQYFRYENQHINYYRTNKYY